MITSTLKPVERLVFRSDTALLAEYRCDPTNPLFENSGPANAHCIVFPLTSTRIIRNRLTILETPMVVSLFNEGDEYSSEKVSDEGSHCAWLTLDTELLLEIAGPAARRGSPFAAYQIRSNAALTLRQRQLFRLAREHPDAEPLAIEEESIAIAEEVMAAHRGGRAALAAGPPGRLINRVLDRLAASYSESLSLSDVARDVNASPAYLSRAFRKATGQTMHTFREELRLRRSLDLLPDSRGDLTGLALDLGYSSHSHFTNRFHRLFGITPAAFAGPAKRPTRRRTAIKALTASRDALY